MKGFDTKAPIRTKKTISSSMIEYPVWAVWKASSSLLSPRRLDMTEQTPTLVPTANEAMSICIGNARETAVRAFSLKRDTKMLSTML